MKKIEYESIDDSLMDQALQGEKLVQVSQNDDYLEKMEKQNIKVLKYLQDKYPERCFKLSKWYSHDFGQYQEVMEGIEYDIDDDDDFIISW